MAFDRDTTAEEVLDGFDLTGRHVVVTGATSGLGEESARAFAAHGATVTLLGRTAERLGAAAGRIGEAVPGARLRQSVVDLGDLASVRRGAAEVVAGPPVDVLLNSAGVMCVPFGKTVDGNELHFGTNHLGHFLLTALLSPALTDDGRVVVVSSAAHSISDVDLDDPNFERTPYDEWVGYGRSKTANALFARELARRGRLAFAVHPGTVMTDLYRHATPELLAEAAEKAKARAGATGTDGPRVKSVEAGAATQVWAAVEPSLVDHGGAYLADCRLGEVGANPSGHGFLPYLLDDDNARRLWTLSEELVDERFEP